MRLLRLFTIAAALLSMSCCQSLLQPPLQPQVVLPTNASPNSKANANSSANSNASATANADKNLDRNTNLEGNQNLERNTNPKTVNKDPLTSFIKVPPGFTVDVYAKGLECPRQLALSPNGTLFIGTKINNNGKVYAITNKNKDNVGDQVFTIADNLKCPNGVAFHDGALYVAEINRILRYDDIESKLSTSTKLAPPTVVNSQFPSEGHHGWKYIRFGPDNKLYVPVGAPCNVCEPDKSIFASIMRMNQDGSNLELFASGIRNTVGFDFHPQTKQLWFTDNGRDLLGDDLPPDELNCAERAGMNFGFPYRYGNNIPDPIFGGKAKADSNFTPPVVPLGAHVAALGMRFYNGKQFPSTYQGNIFIAEHGSWNRSKKTGCRITRVVLDDTTNKIANKYEVFAEGWLNQDKQEYAGRPVDIVVADDGALFVSDDSAGVIYRISYKKPI